MEARDELEHLVRGRLAIVVGEVELVLAEADVPPDERARSRDRVLDAVRAIERALAAGRAGPVRRRGGAGSVR